MIKIINTSTISKLEPMLSRIKIIRNSNRAKRPEIITSETRKKRIEQKDYKEIIQKDIFIDFFRKNLYKHILHEFHQLLPLIIIKNKYFLCSTISC